MEFYITVYNVRKHLIQKGVWRCKVEGAEMIEVHEREPVLVRGVRQGYSQQISGVALPNHGELFHQRVVAVVVELVRQVTIGGME